MSRLYILDDGGDPVPVESTLEWSKWFETADRSVANTYVGEARVSTVFLGLDHNFGEGEPVLWGTIIFGGNHDGYKERYSSKTAAMEGHNRAVSLAKETALTMGLR